MTTRVLASFDEFDRYSKEVLSRHSRRNKLSHGEKCCTTFDELRSPFGVADDWEVYPLCDTETSKSKLNVDITNVKNPHHHSKAKCAPSPHQQPRSIQKVCSKVNICPFKGSDDVSQKTEDRKEKKECVDGFMVVRLQKTPSVIFRKYVPLRTKWSSEIEHLAPMDVRLNSKAQIGGTLHYSNTSHWSSSSSSSDERPVSAFTEDENGHFTLTSSVGKVVTEQLQQGNIVRVTTSARRSEDNGDTEQVSMESEPEPASLCLEDELKRNPTKVLSPRVSTAYTPLPIVSETFPVIYNTGQPHNKAFNSQGFHTLDPTDPLPRRGTYMEHYERGNKIHSAIIRLTDSMQEHHAASFQDKAAKWSPLDWLDASVDGRFKHSERGLENTNLRVLSADGTLVGPSKQDGLHMPSPALEPKTMALALLCLKPQPGPHGSVGTVLNGVNPKKNYMSLHNIKAPDSEDKSWSLIHGHPRPKVSAKKTSVSAPVKKSGSFLIAKPLLPNKSYPCISVHTENTEKKNEWHPLTATTHLQLPGLGSVHGTSIGLYPSRPQSHMNPDVPCMARNTPIPEYSDDQKGFCEHVCYRSKGYDNFIIIPTADSVHSQQ